MLSSKKNFGGMRKNNQTFQRGETSPEYVNRGGVQVKQQAVDAFEVPEFTTGGWIKFILGLIFLFPFRVVLSILSALILVIIYVLNLPIIGPADKPQNCLVRFERVFVGRCWCRFMMFINGFFWIREHGKPNPKANLLVANHSSCLDMFFFSSKFAPSYVVAEFVGKNFFLGPLSRVFNCPVIDRKSSGNSGDFLQKLRIRLEDEEMCRLFGKCVIFPEGATSNGRCLNYFHSGAFIPGQPMQPIVLQYKDKINPTNWSVRSWTFHFLVMMCNLTNNLDVTYLPLYYPSEAEKKNPRFYAQNIKNAMSASLSTHEPRIGGTDSLSQPFSHLKNSTLKDNLPLKKPFVNAFFPQTILTYKDRKDYERARKDIKNKGESIPQPRDRTEVMAEHVRFCCGEEVPLNTTSSINNSFEDTESSLLNSSPSSDILVTPSYSSSSTTTPLSGIPKVDSSNPDSSTSCLPTPPPCTTPEKLSLTSPVLSVTSNSDSSKSASNISNIQALAEHSGLLFLLNVPPECYDYHLQEYHSEQQLPSQNILEIVNQGFHKPSTNNNISSNTARNSLPFTYKSD